VSSRRFHYLALIVWLSSGGAAPAGTPPAGFQETTLVPGITQITGFEWAPNGDLWIISKPGIVQLLHPGAPAPVTALTLNVNTIDERGLLGIAIDPDFALNGFVYLYYTTATAPIHNRVSRFQAVGDTLQNETPLLDGPTLTKVFHNSGCMRFGPDGLLYISVGDNGIPNLSQDRRSLLGKILRIARDGSIPPSNPFVGDPNARPEVWAYGLRNPWRFNIQPDTGNLFIGDVGDGNWEELDLGFAGANYGYPLVEGPQPPAVAGMTYPIFSYPHNGSSASITGGDHMVAGNFPSQYEGNYFYGDYALGKIWRMTLDADNLPVTNEEFATDAAGPVHIRVGPDGALYYAAILDSSIYRIAYVGGINQQPNAVAEATPASGLSPLSVQFDGTGSSDPDQGTVTYSWNFADGSPLSTAPSPQHTYANSGVFNAILTVEDPQLATDTSTVRIVAGNQSPIVSIASPIDGSNFNAGDIISFSGSSADPEEGSVPTSRLSWTVLFHHDIHTHPFLGPTPGVSSGTFQTLDSGELDPDVWYEVRLTASDTGSPLGAIGALSSTQSINIYPNLTRLSYATLPRPDLMLTLDARPFSPPRDAVTVVGLRQELEAVSPQLAADGHTYTFRSWSDGGARLHTITALAAGATYTAIFGCDLMASPTDLELAPASGGRITLTWRAPQDDCLSFGPISYRVYGGSTRLPSVPPGQFPIDPPFSVIASTTSTSVNITPFAGLEYFIVVGMGTDGAEGPSSHYGNQ